MLKRVKNKLNTFLYDKDTGYMLNYVTLNVKDKIIEKEIAFERAERINKIYWYTFTFSFVGFIIQMYQLIIKTADMNIIIHFSCFFACFVIWGIARCWVNWAARIIFPIYFLFVIIFEVTLV